MTMASIHMTLNTMLALPLEYRIWRTIYNKPQPKCMALMNGLGLVQYKRAIWKFGTVNLMKGERIENGYSWAYIIGVWMDYIKMIENNF